MAFQLLPPLTKSLLHMATRLNFLKYTANYVNCLKCCDVFVLQQNKIQTPAKPRVTCCLLVSLTSSFPSPTLSLGLSHCCLLHPLWTHPEHSCCSVFDVSSSWNVDTKFASVSSSVLNWCFPSLERSCPSTWAEVSSLPHHYLQYHLFYFHHGISQ